MGATYVQDDETIDYTPVADTVPGTVVVIGDLIGVAKRLIPAGTLGGLVVEGTFDFPKTAGGGTAITAGTKVYWDTVAKVATATAGALKYLGKTIKDAADADVTVRVRLQQ
jgi:predicted RecA/RadA family phage recombinase